MAIAFRTSKSAVWSVSQQNQAVSLPAGVLDGDIVLLCVFVGGANPDPITNLPTGATQLYPGADQTGARVRGWYFFWHTGDPTSWTVHLNIAGGGGYGIFAYSGVDPTTPLDCTSASASGGSNLHPTSPSITTVTDNAMLVCVECGASGGLTATPPSGMTERFDQNAGASFSGADESLPTAGATGAQAFTLNAAKAWAAASCALRPFIATFKPKIVSGY